MAETRPILENAYYHWYDSLINHIQDSMKKSESNTKQKDIMIFQSKTDDNTSMDYKPKQIRHSFEGRYVKYKSEKDKKRSITGFLM